MDILLCSRANVPWYDRMGQARFVLCLLEMEPSSFRLFDRQNGVLGFTYNMQFWLVLIIFL